MRRTLVSLFALLIVFAARASDQGDLRQKVLDASHSTRINDVDMKPWHLKVEFHLSSHNGQPSEDGSIEEWWAGLTTWKVRIESPSYNGTVIENRDGDFRTEGVGPIPLRIREIQQDIVYPMPMGEDLSEMVPHTSHQKVDKLRSIAFNCLSRRFLFRSQHSALIKAVARCVQSSLPIRRCSFATGSVSSRDTLLLYRLSPRKLRRCWQRPRLLICPQCNRLTVYSPHHLK